MRKILFILMLSALSFSVGMLTACDNSSNEGFTRSSVEEKMEAAGFTVVTSTAGAGLLKGTIIVSLGENPETVIISIYKSADSVPKVNMGAIQYYENIQVTASSTEMADAVIAALKA